MVRLIIPEGQSWDFDPPSGGPTVTLTGPLDICLEGASLAPYGLVTSGEYLHTGRPWERLLPYTRDELGVSLPVCLVLAMLFGLTWLRKSL